MSALSKPQLKDIVRIARMDAGLTQDELAERVEMSQRWVSHIETKADTVPRLPALRRLATVLNIDLLDLIIAANLARTKAEASRLALAVPDESKDDDPTRSIIELVRQVNWTEDRLDGIEAALLAYLKRDTQTIKQPAVADLVDMKGNQHLNNLNERRRKRASGE